MIAYIYKPNGRRIWRYRLQVGAMTRIEDRSLKTTDKRVAQKLLDDLRVAREMNRAGIGPSETQIAAASKSVIQHLRDFILHLRDEGLDEKHLENYENRLEKLSIACGWKTLDDITAESFLAWRQCAKLKGKTKNQYLSHLRRWMRWLHKVVLRLSADPVREIDAIDTRREERTAKRAFTDQELEKLMTTPRAVVYLIAASSGIRWGELRRLTWGQCRIDVAKPCFVMPPTKTKNKKPAIIPMFGAVQEELRLLRPARVSMDTKVFESLPRHDTVTDDLRRLGITKVDAFGRIAGFHSLRVTFNTMLQRMGFGRAEIQQLMRVSESKLTETTYLDEELILLGERPNWPRIQRSHGRSHGLHPSRHSVAFRGTNEGCMESRNHPVKQGENAGISEGNRVVDGSGRGRIRNRQNRRISRGIERSAHIRAHTQRLPSADTLNRLQARSRRTELERIMLILGDDAFLQPGIRGGGAK